MSPEPRPAREAAICDVFAGADLAISAEQAANRLEAAVERLAQALARPRPAGAGVPQAEIAALSARLDDTIARLRAALPEADGLPAEEE